MAELARRYGFNSRGGSVVLSEEDEDDQSSVRDGGAKWGGASANDSPPPSAPASTTRTPRRGRPRDHRGIPFEQMRAIFGVLVRRSAGRNFCFPSVFHLFHRGLGFISPDHLFVFPPHISKFRVHHETRRCI